MRERAERWREFEGEPWVRERERERERGDEENERVRESLR